ncbi:hypothetical protein FKG94_19395 [Exilibacterium tricleocarpae]|uniref:Uncharacterized protein n=1 Tax=Exilibacterium tricleocarpae TaxID=2591008 RepID=A0A545T3M7_9GAMM|nr:hypothetical protein [Exilibacterium tricleocarpae]TQV71810.1 hypothetical protein FKG94_19395 [Exilibacterium tricleocarpae]
MDFRTTLSSGLQKAHLLPRRDNGGKKESTQAVDRRANPGRIKNAGKSLKSAVAGTGQRIEKAGTHLKQSASTVKNRTDNYITSTTADTAYTIAEKTVPSIAAQAARGAFIASGLRDEIARVETIKNPLSSDTPDLTMPGALPIEKDEAEEVKPENSEGRRFSKQAQNALEKLRKAPEEHRQRLRDTRDLAAFHTTVDTAGMFLNGAVRAAGPYLPSLPDLPPELDRKTHDLPLMPATLPEQEAEIKDMLTSQAPPPSMQDKAKNKLYDKASDATFSTGMLVAQGALQRISRNNMADNSSEEIDIKLPGSFPKED